MTLSAPHPIDDTHVLTSFDCGQPGLDDWLQRHALANQKGGASKTFVVAEGRDVMGYYSLAAGSISHGEARGKLRRNMPDPVPMALLGRLAVDRRRHRTGVGVALLGDAMQRVVLAADQLGIRGVMVDAIDDSAKRFYEKFGFVASPVSPLKLMVTLDEVMRTLGRTP